MRFVAPVVARAVCGVYLSPRLVLIFYIAIDSLPPNSCRALFPRLLLGRIHPRDIPVQFDYHTVPTSPTAASRNMSTEAQQNTPAVKEQPNTPAQNGTTTRAQPAQESQTYHQIAATHIDTLSKINEQLPKLLTYFAAAISQLTNNPIETPVSKDQPDSPQARQQALWVMTMYVGAAIKEIREELSKQINDLERYGVIPAKHPKYTSMPKQGQSANEVDPEATVKNGGYGDFDVGVLNARAASGHIGGDDVLDRVKAMVEDLMKRSGVEANGDNMAVD